MPLWKAFSVLALCASLGACGDTAVNTASTGAGGEVTYASFIAEGGYKQDLAAAITVCERALGTGNVDITPLQALGYEPAKKRLGTISTRRLFSPSNPLSPAAVFSIGKRGCIWSASRFTVGSNPLYLAAGEALYAQGYTLVVKAQGGKKPEYRKGGLTLRVTANSFVGSARIMNVNFERVGAA